MIYADMEKKQVRKTLGILINDLDLEYQREIWKGVEKAASKQDINVLFLGGGIPDSPYDSNNKFAKLYDYINPETVDGLLSISATIGGFIGLEALISKITSLMGNIPILNYGPSYPGIPSAIFDNTSGIKDLVRHLVEVHGRKRMVFMGGLDTNIDGAERKKAFIKTLKEYELEPATEGLLTGNYRYGLAYEQLNKWLDKEYEFDAVVSACDSMAFACYYALKERGYKVPEDVSLTGFDNFTSARYFDVPLTTVHQPVKEIAFWSIESLLKMTEKSHRVKDKYFESSAVLRQSCGCFSQSTILAQSEISEQQLLKECSNIDEKIREELIQLYHSQLDGKIEEEFFLRKFQSVLRETIYRSDIYASWENFVSYLRKLLYMKPGIEKSSQEDILHKLRTMVKENAEQVQANIQQKMLHHIMDVQYASAGTVGSFSLERFVKGLPVNLKGLKIDSCFISLLEEGSNDKLSRLIFGYYNEQELEIPPEKAIFQTHELFPRDLLPDDNRFNLFAETLFHEEKQIGLIVLGNDPGNGTLITAFNSIIRSSLRSSMMVDEITQKDKKLEIMIQQLEKRAKELEEANKQITRDQNQLLASEKMASLGRLTAGIAHEMNTPLAAIRASINEISSLVQEYQQSFMDPDVSPEDHREIAEEMMKALQLADNAGEKASSFIRSIKTQTRDDQTDAPSVQFRLKQVIDECVTLLGHKLRYEKCTVKLQMDNEKLSLCGKPGKFSQVITNLLGNAIEAMSPNGGIIGINVTEKDSQAITEICDEGPGILPDIIDKIFDPLFTTKPFGVGTGLGLTICHDIIKGDFKGSLEVKNRKESGAIFTIRIPNTQEKCNG